MKTKLMFMSMGLLIAMTGLQAKPFNLSNCCMPEPIGGLQQLQESVEYPKFALAVRMEAEVVLRLTVDKLGNVVDITVSKSGGRSFDQAAISAVSVTPWIPARQGGFPVKVEYLLPFKFRIG